jgi:pentatricopeptide repeat protein
MPTSLNHLSILLGLCKNRLLVEARWYLKNVATKYQPNDVAVYNVVIDGYAKMGDISNAVELYDQIVLNGMYPTIITCNSLLYGYCKTGNLHMTENYFRAIQLSDLLPTAVTYTTLMDALSEAGEVQMMLNLFHEMISKGVKPNEITYSVVIKGHHSGQGFHSRPASLRARILSSFQAVDKVGSRRRAVLPSFIDVELRGLPAHAWELTTAQQLLSGSCWVSSLHPDTAAKRDLSVFCASDWCVRPERLPPVVDLLIPEPASADAEMPPTKRGLLYPVAVASHSGAAGGPPPSPSAQGREQPRRRRPSSPRTALGTGSGSLKSTPCAPTNPSPR